MDQHKTCPACLESIDVRAARCARCGQRQPDATTFFRNVPGRLLGGVAAALALQFNWDVMVMRVVLVGVTAITGGATLWIYLGLWVMTPFDLEGRAPALRFADWLGRLFSPPMPAPAPHHEPPSQPPPSF